MSGDTKGSLHAHLGHGITCSTAVSRLGLVYKTRHKARKT